MTCGMIQSDVYSGREQTCLLCNIIKVVTVKSVNSVIPKSLLCIRRTGSGASDL